MENLGIFYDHLVYFTAIGNTLGPFRIFCGNLVYFPRFGILDQEKSGNPGQEPISKIISTLCIPQITRTTAFIRILAGTFKM
jgi:hypothetical protein